MLVVSGAGVYACLTRHQGAPLRQLGYGLGLGWIGAIGIVAGQWSNLSWQTGPTLAFAASIGTSLGGVIVLVTSRSSSLAVIGFLMGVAGIVGIALSGNSVSAVYVLVAGILIPVGSVATFLSPRIRSRQGVAELIEPAMACGMAAILAATLFANLQMPKTFELRQIFAAGWGSTVPTPTAAQPRAASSASDTGTQMDSASQMPADELALLATALTDDYRVLLGMVATLIAIGSCGLLWNGMRGEAHRKDLAP